MPKKIDTKTFIERSRKTHGDLYDYRKVIYERSDKPVIIICKVEGHPEFSQRPGNHIAGQGCPLCGRAKCENSHRLTPKEVIDRFRKAHGEKYDYSKMEYIDNSTKIKIICPKTGHGEFSQIPSDHWGGHGCVKCMAEEGGNQRRKALDDFLVEARELHGDKYDYSEFVYTNALTKSIVICPIHGPWQVSANSHLTRGGTGCPKCGDLKSGMYGLTAYRENPEFADEYNELYFVSIGEFRKFGIAKDTEKRHMGGGSIRYDEVFYVRGTTRACAWCVEQHLLLQSEFAKLEDFPPELKKWPGRYEIRKNVFNTDETIEMMDSLLDEAEEIGWEQFAAKYQISDYGYSWIDPRTNKREGRKTT